MSEEKTTIRGDFTLANLRHLGLFMAILHLKGSICPDCGHGTRATSKRWAKCKKCGRMKIRRRTRTEVEAKLDELRAEADSRTPPDAKRRTPVEEREPECETCGGKGGWTRIVQGPLGGTDTRDEWVDCPDCEARLVEEDERAHIKRKEETL